MTTKRRNWLTQEEKDGAREWQTLPSGLVVYLPKGWKRSTYVHNRHWDERTGQYVQA